MRTFHFSPSKKVTSPKCSRLAVLFIYLDVNKRDFRAQPSSRTRIICLKELKRDNEYLIANRKDGTEAVCLHFSATYQLLRLLLDSRTESATYFATVHHSDNRLFLCMMRPFGRSRMLCATCQQSRWWQTNSRIMKRVFLCCFVLLVWSPSARSCLLIASHVQRLTRMSCSVSLAPPNIFLFCPNVFFSGSFVKATERRVKCKTDSALFVIEDRH